jgi:NADPH:quinone reductase
VNTLFSDLKFRVRAGLPTLTCPFAASDIQAHVQHRPASHPPRRRRAAAAMKAIVCQAYGPIEDLRWQDVTPLPLAPHDVRITVHAAGVNFADALKVQGRHQVKVVLPWTPGAEMAGVVSECGAAVDHLQPGDRVLGVPDDRAGGYAEAVALPAERVLPMPAERSFEGAAALPAAYGTALYALDQRGRLARGEWVLVLGAAGGVGLAAVQVAAALGARVIAGASTASKRELAARHGASHVVDYTRADWRQEVLAITGAAGVQVVFDPVGGDVFDEAIRTVGWGGRYLVIGFAAGRIPALPVNHPLVKGYDVVGVRYDVWRDRFWPQARGNLMRILGWWTEGLVRPVVSRTERIDHAAQALSALANRQVSGKLVLTAPHPPSTGLHAAGATR